MGRGYTWGDYRDDDGNEWALAVDSDYITDPDRGWTLAGDTGLVPLPRQWRPRRVIGIDSRGGKQQAVVGSVEASLWTGAVTTFTFKPNSGETETATVVEYRGEKRVPVRLDP